MRTRRLQNLQVPMRDGVRLSLDVRVPEPMETPRPVVLVRTCYDKNRYMNEQDGVSTAGLMTRRLLAEGFAVAAQDVRGRFNSDGAWGMYFAEFDDGEDTLEWIAGQPWCNGRIGMYGSSYEATTQLAAARSGHPALKAIVPVSETANSMWDNEPLRGGAFLAPMVQYAVDMGRRTYQHVDFRNTLWAHDRASSMTLPFKEIPTAEGITVEWVEEMLDHPEYDEFWERGALGAWEQFLVPALHISGWWDMNLAGALVNYPGMRAGSGTERARHGQRLVVGPWPHWMNLTTTLNGVNLGEHALIDMVGLVAGFLVDHVRDEVEAPPAPARVFVLGANEWWDVEWPVPDAEPLAFHLDSDGRANSRYGDGRLVPQVAASPADRFSYNPCDPVHAFFHMCVDGPVDDSEPSSRPDVLCYSTPVLEQPLHVVGPVTLNLWAASSALDTDWHVRLVDVHPDGTARYLSHGVLRARFRKGYDAPELLEPERPYEYTIAMDGVAVRFDPGHRIRLEVASSWSPRYDRNTNTGADNPFYDASPVVAHQTVLHDPDHPSRLVLPVVTDPPHGGAFDRAAAPSSQKETS